MRTLADPRHRDAIVRRLRTLHPGSARRWGRMSVHEAVCHLADSMRMATGHKATSPDTSLFRTTALKWIALWAPLPWPAGIPTSPELDARGGGTAPTDLARDLAELEALVARVATAGAELARVRHPYFGRMSEAAWLRWAWLHLDHHLRQFGA